MRRQRIFYCLREDIALTSDQIFFDLIKFAPAETIAHIYREKDYMFLQLADQPEKILYIFPHFEKVCLIYSNFYFHQQKYDRDEETIYAVENFTVEQVEIFGSTC